MPPPALAQTGAGREFITNGGFEDGPAGRQPAPEHRPIEETGQAHSGARGLFGEVTKPNDSRVLRRTLDLDPNKEYEFSIWGPGHGLRGHRLAAAGQHSGGGPDGGEDR